MKTFINEAEPTTKDLEMIEVETCEFKAGELLTADEELKCARLVAEGGAESKTARDKLVNGNIRLVKFVAKKYIGRGVDFEDLVSIGIEGLISAVDKFDYKLGYRFSTYAVWWIKQAIIRGSAKEGGSIRIPAHLAEKVYKVKKAQAELAQEENETPDIEKLSAMTGLTSKQVNLALNAMNSVISIDSKISEEGEATIGDTIPDKNATDPYEECENNNLHSILEGVLSSLTEKEARVLQLRAGWGGVRPMTLEEIASLPEFDVSRERIRQIESKALHKIRRNSANISKLRGFAS